MIKDILKDIRELRDEITVKKLKLAQRLKHHTKKYEMKLQEDRTQIYDRRTCRVPTNNILKTPSEKLRNELEPINDVYDERY